jgi:hypothetical protein
MPDPVPQLHIAPFVASAISEVGERGQGNLIENKEPAKAAVALELLAAGETYKEIHKRTGLSLSAVAALKMRHVSTIEERKKMLANDYLATAEVLRQLTMMKAEQLADHPEMLWEVNIRDLVLPAGISFDKGMAAMGEGSKVTIEHVTNKPSIADAQKIIDEARAKLKAQSVEVVVTPLRADPPEATK